MQSSSEIVTTVRGGGFYSLWGYMTGAVIGGY